MPDGREEILSHFGDERRQIGPYSEGLCLARSLKNELHDK